MKGISLFITCLLLISVVRGEDAFNCKQGEGVTNYTSLTSGSASQCSGGSEIITQAECALAAFYNSKNDIDKNEGFGGPSWMTHRPFGCFYDIAWKRYYFSKNKKSETTCDSRYECICKRKKCRKCPINRYSKGGANALCIPCKAGEVTDSKQTKCINPSKLYDSLLTLQKRDANLLQQQQQRDAKLFEEIKKDLTAQKEKQNDLSIKNSRLWQKEQIRMQHDKLLARRKNADNKKEKDSCKQEQIDRTVIFPAIEISSEIEKIEDTTCIDTNRDEMLKSFCSFTSDLDRLFRNQGIKNQTSQQFWPNICCKERRDKILEACEDPTGEINRADIIPFALSQGGDYSRHNLYVEVSDSIKKDGYINSGMIKLIESLKPEQKDRIIKKVNSFFDDISLCGPRIVDSPGEESKLCQLFIPYHHAMKNFYNVVAEVFDNRINDEMIGTMGATGAAGNIDTVSATGGTGNSATGGKGNSDTLNRPTQVAAPTGPVNSAFLETMEGSLRKRQLGKKNSINEKYNMQVAMKLKVKQKQEQPKAEKQCEHKDKKFSQRELATLKPEYCSGYNHLDLSKKEIKNIAIHYLNKEISKNDTVMSKLSRNLYYDVQDGNCPAAPLFTAKDVSIQQISTDALGENNEWVAVVKLNTEDENSYLKSEVPNCERADYLIGATVKVKAYVDEGKRKPLKDIFGKDYSKEVVLTGTHYEVTSSNVGRRRKLLKTRSGLS